MGVSRWKKASCATLLAMMTLLSGCGGQDKVAAVDMERLQAESTKIKAIVTEVQNKNTEIRQRLDSARQEGASSEDMQKKMAAAQQEGMVFTQSKQKQIQSLVEAQCAAVAKEKDIGIVMHKPAVSTGYVDITDEVLKRIDGAESAGK